MPKTFVETHCCSFEQAQQLIELGVANISTFKFRPDGSVIYPTDGLYSSPWESFENRNYPAFTDGEMLKMINLNAYVSAKELAIILIDFLRREESASYLKNINNYLESTLLESE